MLRHESLALLLVPLYYTFVFSCFLNKFFQPPSHRPSPRLWLGPTTAFCAVEKLNGKSVP